VLHQSQILLADATGAISEEKQPGFFGSLWKQYLSIFEGVLTGVHSTIDEPLRSIGITQTWGISIFLFTAGKSNCSYSVNPYLLISFESASQPLLSTSGMRSLLIPLSIQQNKSAEYQKLLKPYIKEIRQKFKDNDQLRNRALGKLYEDSQQSPFNGCLLSLAQLPILLGLYRGIRLLAKDNLLKEPFLWIPSLEGPTSPPEFRDMDWLTTGWHNIDGIPTPLLGWETTLAFLIMPIVLVLGQSLTLRVLTPQMDTDEMSEEERDTFEKSQLVFKFLPLMLGYFSLQVPAGLTIYWFTSNVFTLSQSLAIRAYYKANPPKIELPEYWDSLNDIENMSAEERRAATEAGLNVAPTLTSLREGMFSVGSHAFVLEPYLAFLPFCFCPFQSPCFTMWCSESRFAKRAQPGLVWKRLANWTFLLSFKSGCKLTRLLNQRLSLWPMLQQPRVRCYFVLVYKI
jgi:YidC/Oxa1 family membrane protein insertase